MRDFYGCYLLHSKHPQSKDRTYIGFTVNPRRRIKQHNGVITQGAFRTSKWRPWDMALVVYGFPTKVQALQFEWAWQHPAKSKAVRALAAQLGKRGLTGVRGKMHLLLGMLSLPPWTFYPLTMQYLSSAYAVKAAGLPQPPPHMRVLVAPLEDLPARLTDDEADDDEEDRVGFTGLGSGDEAGGGSQMAPPGGSQAEANGSEDGGEGEEETAMEALFGTGIAPAVLPPNGRQWECDVCGGPIERHVLHCSCGAGFHIECLAADWTMQAHYNPLEDGSPPALPKRLDTSALGMAAPPKRGRGRGTGQASALPTAPPTQTIAALPEQGYCPACGKEHRWLDLLSAMLPYGQAVPPQRGRRARTSSRGKAGSSRGTRKVVSSATGGATSGSVRGRGRKRGGGAVTTAATTGSERSRSPRKPRSRSPALARVQSDGALPDLDMAALPTPKSSRKPVRRRPKADGGTPASGSSIVLVSSSSGGEGGGDVSPTRQRRSRQAQGGPSVPVQAMPALPPPPLPADAAGRRMGRTTAGDRDGSKPRRGRPPKQPPQQEALQVPTAIVQAATSDPAVSDSSGSAAVRAGGSKASRSRKGRTRNQEPVELNPPQNASALDGEVAARSPVLIGELRGAWRGGSAGPEPPPPLPAPLPLLERLLQRATTQREVSATRRLTDAPGLGDPHAAAITATHATTSTSLHAPAGPGRWRSLLDQVSSSPASSPPAAAVPTAGTADNPVPCAPPLTGVGAPPAASPTPIVVMSGPPQLPGARWVVDLSQGVDTPLAGVATGLGRQSPDVLCILDADDDTDA